MIRLYFTLRGDNEHLARGELKALLETIRVNVGVECYTMICITSPISNLTIAEDIMSRAGYLKESGILLNVFNAYSERDAREAGNLLEEKRAHISIFKSTVSENAVKTFLKVAGVEHATRGIGEYRLIFSDGLVFLGVKKFTVNTRSFEERARSKPFKRSIELSPEIARVLINLSRAKRGGLLLDPFAGTGVILIEAWSMGIRAIGVDIDSIIVRGMENNILFFNTNSLVVYGDSRTLLYRCIDHVATDLPYGRSASTHGADIRDLYKGFAEKLSSYLSRCGYAVLMTPHWLEDYVDEILYSHGFRVVERYYDYVHSSLTRVINVVKWR